MLKVLCLPGYHTNKEFMDFQMKNFKQYFKSLIEFTIIDPPFGFSERELLETAENIRVFCQKTKTKPRNWLTYEHISQGPGKLEVYLDKALNFLIDYLENSQKYDGIFGFSQGGLLLDYFFFESAKENSRISDKIKPKFGVIASPNYLGYEGDSLKKRPSIPVAFLIGEMDYFFMRTCMMTTFYEKNIMVFHKEGHKIPNLNDEAIRKLKEFFVKFQGNSAKL